METETLLIQEVKHGNILTPQGFSAGGIHAGLKHSKYDLGMIYSDVPAQSAAVYTTNAFQAAPIYVTKDSLKVEGMLQGIVVNSGNANACTGKKGLQDAYEMRKLAAKKLSINEHYVAVASTGVIGEFLPMDKIADGIQRIDLGQTTQHAEDFQQAILTTDTCTKSCCYKTDINGKTVYMGGAAKGSGMIHPNMATMLSFITTDANISSENLQYALRSVIDHTFNQITVDGDTSTNDMVLVMANGKAGNELLDPNHPEWHKFLQLLEKTCEYLAKQIARDGEGATKLVEVEVTGARSDEEARKIAKQIIGSNLVKTAVFGADANWGRIICAVGQADAYVDVEKVTIAIGPISMLENSTPVPFSEEEAKTYLENDYIQIFVDLNIGEGKGKAWGCDLSYDYVKINASYRS